tara:strand:+ start:561 stop:743 length:183 start_codon:yes stop_codon:yes gene_type:complete
MGNRGNPSRKSRWSGKAHIKAEEKRRRREEAKFQILEQQMQTYESTKGVTLIRRIPKKYD